MDLCIECHGKIGPDGNTGYWIFNAYDDSKRWMVCEVCQGTGKINHNTISLTLEEFNSLINDD